MINLDIDMPTGCRFCPIFNGEFGECQLRQCFPSRFNEVRALFDERPNNCPLVEDVPKGEWIEEAVPIALIGRGNRQRRCSLCGHRDIQAKTQEVPYCWHCGAKMRC